MKPHRTASLRRQIRNRLEEYYTPDEALLWLRSPHPQLSGQTPLDTIKKGRARQVEAILDRLDTDAYL